MFTVEVHLPSGTSFLLRDAIGDQLNAGAVSKFATIDDAGQAIINYTHNPNATFVAFTIRDAIGPITELI